MFIRRVSLFTLILFTVSLAHSAFSADTTIKGTGNSSATTSLEVTNSADTSLLYVRNDGAIGIRSVAYTWPAADASGVLTSNGTGTLTWSTTGTGTAVLSGISAATTDASINSGANNVVWNWQLTGAETALKITENLASSGGSSNQYLLEASTLANSTAIPLYVKNLGTGIAFDIDASNTTTDAVDITGTALTSGDALQIGVDSGTLTTGKAIRVLNSGTERFSVAANGTLNVGGGGGAGTGVYFNSTSSDGIGSGFGRNSLVTSNSGWIISNSGNTAGTNDLTDLSRYSLRFTNDGTTVPYGIGLDGSNKPLIASRVADGGTAVAHTLDTESAYSTAGAKLLSIKNDNTEKFYVDKDGNAAMRAIAYAWPAADASGVLTSNGSGTLSWAAASGGAALSSITAAAATNTIDNTNYAQVWNWSTADDEVAFTSNANALTSGSLLSLASSSTGLTGDLAKIQLTGANAGNTGNVLKVGFTGTTGTAVPLNVTNGGTSVSFRVNDDATYTDSTPFVVDATGSVGIGTATPSTALTLGAGQITVPDGTAGAPSYSFSSEPSLGMYRDTNASITFNTIATRNISISNSFGLKIAGGNWFGWSIGNNDSTAAADTVLSKSAANTVRISSDGGTGSANLIVNGNVGVGTTSPESRLEVQGAEGIDAILTLDADDGDDNSDTWFIESEAADNDLSIVNHTTELMKLTTAGALSLVATGMLDLSGIDASATSEGLKLPQAASCAAATAEGQVCWDTNDDDLYVGDGAAVVQINSAGGGGALSALTAAAGTNTIDNTNYAQVWNWSTADDEVAFTSNANALTSGSLLSLASSSTGLTGDLMKAELTGANAGNTGNVLKVGFTGTTGTAVPLNVTNGGTSVSFRVNDDATYTDSTPFVVDATGSVGIGIAAPTKPLHVFNSASGDIALFRDETDAADVTIGGNNIGPYVRGGAGDKLLIMSNASATAHMTVDTTGNVGIGDTSADAALEVLSTTEQLRLTYTDGTVDSRFTVDSSGNLSINNTGTKTTIADALEVTGNTTFSTTSLVDLSNIDASTTAEGIKLPQNTSCTSATAEGQVCWDSDDDNLYVGKGAAVTPMSRGWHGSPTRIKILPSDFITNDDDGDNQEAFDEANHGVVMTAAGTDLYAFVPIPSGYKATHARVYGSSTDTVTVYEANLTDGTWSAGLGNADTGTEIDITDVNSTTTNYLVIQVAANNTADIIYGGYVTIAEI